MSVTVASKGVKYCLVDLPRCPPDVAAWIEQHVHPRDVVPFYSEEDGTSFDGLPVPYPYYCPRVKPDVLTNPVGANRFATFFAVVDEAGLTAIRAYTTGSTANYGTLALLDGIASGNATIDYQGLTWTMFALPALPLQTGTGENRGLFLLPLVDARYFLRQRFNTPIGSDLTGGPDYGPAGSNSTPAFQVANAATREPAAAIGSGGGDGSSNWPGLSAGRWTRPTSPVSAAVLHDGAAAVTGCRVVWASNTGGNTGTGTAWYDPVSARAVYDAQYTALESRRVAGGRIAGEDLFRGVPAAATVRVGTSGYYGPYTATLASLALAEYGAYTGDTNSRAELWLEEAAKGDLQIILAAATLAKSYYRWQLADVNAVYAGWVNWRQTGFEDRIEHDVAEGVTRVYPHPKQTHAAAVSTSRPVVYGVKGELYEGGVNSSPTALLNVPHVPACDKPPRLKLSPGDWFVTLRVSARTVTLGTWPTDATKPNGSYTFSATLGQLDANTNNLVGIISSSAGPLINLQREVQTVPAVGDLVTSVNLSQGTTVIDGITVVTGVWISGYVTTTVPEIKIIKFRGQQDGNVTFALPVRVTGEVPAQVGLIVAWGWPVAGGLDVIGIRFQGWYELSAVAVRFQGPITPVQIAGQYRPPPLPPPGPGPGPGTGGGISAMRFLTAGQSPPRVRTGLVPRYISE